MILKIINLILIVIVSSSVFAMNCESNNGLLNKNAIQKQSQAKDQDLYFVIDTISTNRVSVVIDSMKACYAFVDSVNLSNLCGKNLIDVPGCYILSECFYRDIPNPQTTNKYLLHANEIYSNDVESYIDIADKRQICHGLCELIFLRKPLYYIYVLIQGKEINLQVFPTYFIDGNTGSKFNIRNGEAFYKVLVPVWRKRKSIKKD